MLQLRFPLDLGTWDASRSLFTERAYCVCESVCVWGACKMSWEHAKIVYRSLDSNALRWQVAREECQRFVPIDSYMALSEVYSIIPDA